MQASVPLLQPSFGGFSSKSTLENKGETRAFFGHWAGVAVRETVSWHLSKVAISFMSKLGSIDAMLLSQLFLTCFLFSCGFTE